LAAQDLLEEALESLDELETESLFEALRHLAFGAGTEAEEAVYEDIITCIQSRGFDRELDAFFSEVERPMARPDINSSLSSWD